MERYEAMYINGWLVALLNHNGLTISKMVSRHTTKARAEMEAKRLNARPHNDGVEPPTG